MNTRAIATKSILDIFDGKYSLLTLDNKLSSKDITPQDKSFVKLLCYEFFRNYYSLDKLLVEYVNKSTKPNIKILIMLGLLQILEIKQPEYASINETVNACKDLKVLWAKKLVNGVLRNILRNIDNIRTQYCEHKITESPKWILNNLKEQYPSNYLDIIKGTNSKADMFIRLNISKDTNLVIQYLDDNDISYEHTNIKNCIRLHKAIDVKNNSLFQQGYFSVQDMSAQYAGFIINPKTTDVILDACAAPGGKTTHILELDTNAQVTAIDIIDKRLDLLNSNIERVSLNRDVKIIKHDLTTSLDGKFNKIVLDAPCSALGTIKRNPDIKMSRKPIDIDSINVLQQQILQNLWDNNLIEGGQLLYITCSILEQENQLQISKFLGNNSNVEITKIAMLEKYETDLGYQILPTLENGDGFYYCLLKKII